MYLCIYMGVWVGGWVGVYIAGMYVSKSAGEGAKWLEILCFYHECVSSVLCRDGAGCQHDVAGGVGQTLCQAFVSYSAGDFASVVDLLYPIRYQIISIGGSHAQVR